MHYYENHAGKITTWFRSSGEPNLQKTYILHTETRKHMEMEERIVISSLSQQFDTTVLNFILSFYFFVACGHLQKQRREASTGGTGDGLCVSRPQWWEKAPALRVICGSVLYWTWFRGDGGHGDITGERCWGTEVRPIFGFCSPSTGGDVDEGGSSVLLSWSLGFLGPGHVVAAWLLTRQSLDQPLQRPPKSHSVQRVVQPPWGREW